MSEATRRRRKFWGWGYEGEGLSAGELEVLAGIVAARFGLEEVRAAPPPELSDLELRPPRVKPPAAVATFASTDPWDRAEHTLGKSYHDLVRGLRREYAHPPDLVAYPGDEAQIAAVLEWAGDAGVATIPYGGGSSVVGGIEPDVGSDYRGVVSVDMRHMDRVLEIDRASRAALIQGGVLGPALEDQLRPHGLTLRHFPQSFEVSSLGGWIATRSGGHFATLHTHIDEFVEGLRVLTPRGAVETRRLPGDGAGVSADRMFIGSEGTLGIVTQAWMRLQDRPRFRASAAITFASFADAWQAAREVVQSGLWPANCRLLDPDEALLSGSGDGTRSILIVTFESADHPLDAWLTRAVEICRGHRGAVPAEAGAGSTDEAASRQGAAGLWRNAFIRGGHFHDAYVRLGMVQETFETAITWDRFDDFHERVLDATRRAVEEQCGRGIVSCRFAYVYPDGPAPYYTVVAPSRPGAETEQWASIKEAASETLLACGGTITHHHAVGRFHRPWYDRQRPDLFAEALRTAKRTLDPAGIMNPGVLIDPLPAVTKGADAVLHW
ncbi:MAG TPA: FAD-binding oxidoreductase [Candidatus Dormibacteraeota bacterium]|nr:FAD-binding oxidoreductase [Candidatus Dormibacteraeota bacterium]